jgi:hypothetical protein
MVTKAMTARAATSDLEDVRAKIQHWRRMRPSSRSRMPDALWDAAVALCEERTVHAVSQQLGLGYDRLRRKVVEAELLQARAAAAETEAPEFVELRLAEPLEGVAAGSTPARTHELEVVRPDGAVLRLRTSDVVDVYELTEAFLATDR